MGFLKKKFSDISVGTLIYMELEGWAYWLFNTWPGALGILLRNIMYAIFFKKKQGIIWVQPRVTIVESNKFVVGKNCGINSGCYINAKGSITFGNNVLVGSNVTISSGKHPIDGIEPPIFERPAHPLPIVIEDDVGIGANAVIMPGVTVKRGTVVGAGAIVTKDTEAYAVVVGAPAKVIRYRNEENKKSDFVY